MSLFDHAQAARILATSFNHQAHPDCDPATRDMLFALSAAYEDAANHMEEEARAAIVAIGGGCTLDHATMKGPHCPACRSPIAKR